MKKVLQILLFASLGLINRANSQVIFASDSLSLQTDKWMDSIKVEYTRYKPYLISADSINPNWPNLVIGINSRCDTFLFNEICYDLQNFNQKFKDYLLSKSATDTTVLQLAFGDNLNIDLLSRSFAILTGSIDDNNTEHGTYYFKVYNPPQEKEKYIKTDTIDLLVGKVFKFNGKIVKKADLRNLLRKSKPELVLLRADNEFTVQDLVDILEIGNDLKVKMILEKK